MKKCEWCGKKLIKTQKRFCSRSCNGHNIQKILRILKVGAFHNPKIRLKIQSMGGKAVTFETHSKAGKIGNITNKKNHTSVYDPKIQSMGGKVGGLIGGAITSEILRNKNRVIWHSIHFDSFLEMEIGWDIHYSIEKLKERKNYQIKVGTLHYDFFIEKFKCFIEYHPWDRDYNKKEYYNKRRKNLDGNGYKNYKLVVIK